MVRILQWKSGLLYDLHHERLVVMGGWQICVVVPTTLLWSPESLAMQSSGNKSQLEEDSIRDSYHKSKARLLILLHANTFSNIHAHALRLVLCTRWCNNNQHSVRNMHWEAPAVCIFRNMAFVLNSLLKPMCCRFCIVARHLGLPCSSYLRPYHGWCHKRTIFRRIQRKNRSNLKVSGTRTRNHQKYIIRAMSIGATELVLGLLYSLVRPYHAVELISREYGATTISHHLVWI